MYTLYIANYTYSIYKAKRNSKGRRQRQSENYIWKVNGKAKSISSPQSQRQIEGFIMDFI